MVYGPIEPKFRLATLKYELTSPAELHLELWGLMNSFRLLVLVLVRVVVGLFLQVTAEIRRHALCARLVSGDLAIMGHALVLIKACERLLDGLAKLGAQRIGLFVGRELGGFVVVVVPADFSCFVLFYTLFWSSLCCSARLQLLLCSR